MAPAWQPILPTRLPRRSLGEDIAQTAAAEVIFPLAATIFVFLRIFLRKRSGVAIRWSDYTIVAILPLLWAIWAIWTYLSTTIIPHGLQGEPLATFSAFLKPFWGLQVLCWPLLLLLKCSVLFFYLEAFGTSRRARYILYGLLAFQVAVFCNRAITNLLICRPVSNLWTDVSKCANLFEYYLISESINMLSEAVLFIFPLPIVWRLRVSAKKRAGIVAAFAVGGLAWSGSIYRFYLMEALFSGHISVQDDDVMPRIMLSNFFEYGIGVVAACLPAMHTPLQEAARAILRRWWKPAFNDSASSDGNDELQLDIVEQEKDKSQVVTIAVSVECGEA